MINIGANVLSDLSPDGIVVINTDSKVEYVNPAFSEMTGYSSEDLIGLDADSLNTRIRELCSTDYDSETFDLKTITEVSILQLERPVQLLVSCMSRIVSDEKNNSQASVLYFHDISREQGRIEHIRNEFLSVAAHKLRTPLVGMLGFSELLLKRDFEPERQKEIVATIFRQSNNFKQMLDDFFDSLRLDVNKGKDFNMEKATLEKILKEEIVNANQHSELVVITLEQPEVWPVLNVDSDKMKQVISNLISNAVKYSPAGSTVSCSTVVRSDNGSKKFGVRVSDQGIGITPGDLARIGEPYYRADEVQSHPGSGLGIAIVKTIIAIHHGQFEITSSKSKGTTATIWLPVLQDA